MDLYARMVVRNDSVYVYDCFLSGEYVVESFVVPSGITVDSPFNVAVNLSYNSWGNDDGPLGNVYLSILKDGVEVSTGEMCEVVIPNNTTKTFDMQITAPAEWGRYDLVLKDESGNRMLQMGQLGGVDIAEPIFVLPVCKSLAEDFESMTANSSTSDKNVMGNYTTWSFTKCGVRSPGEELCKGSNSVMMKKPSAIYSTQPLSYDFIMAQATFFNPTSSLAKYRLEYSLDNGTTWQKVNTVEGTDAAEVPEKSQTLVTWSLHLVAPQSAVFRISMFGGGTAATYLDDFVLYYTDSACDVNIDGEVNLADVNAVIAAIFAVDGEYMSTADVNGDGEINIGDINMIINLILAQ